MYLPRDLGVDRIKSRNKYCHGTGLGIVLLDKHLTDVGVNLGSNYVIGGAMDLGECPEFDNLWTEGIRTAVPQAEYQQAEKDFVPTGTRFFNDHPNMGAMGLECTGFSPFARALQREIGIPIFSWGTLMDFAYSITVHRDYYGHVWFTVIIISIHCLMDDCQT